MSARDLRVAITARAVAPWHGRGGLERHVSDLVAHLARRGVRIELITPPPHGRRAVPVSGLADPDRVAVHHVPYLTFPGAGRRGTTILDRDTAYPLFGYRAGRVAARLAAAGKVDVVHGLGASVLGYALARRRGAGAAPLVLNPQGLEEFGATDPGLAGVKVHAYWPLQRAVRACARAADAVLATDRSLVEVVLKHLDVEPERIRVVPNAIDLERLDALGGPADGARLRAARGVPASSPLLLSVGRLEANKGFHVLADALARLAPRAGDLRWVVVGDGPYRALLERRVAVAGLAGCVHWARGIGDAELHAWYEAADLFVHPTLYEGSSLVTLEAMAHRRPVIATRAGGLPDKVLPGTTGWLVTPGDAPGLEHALREALDARSQWAAFGTAARALVEREFAWPAVAGRLIDVYHAVRSARERSTA